MRKLKNIKCIHRLGMLLFLSLLCMGPLALLASAQTLTDAKVSLSLHDATVETFANEIARQTGLTISYEDNDVKALKGVSFDVREQPLSSLLITLSNQLPFTYHVEGSTLYLGSSKANQRKKGFYGQVTDSNGEPLIGAIIRVEGMNGGLVTDVNGEYHVQSDKKEAKITVSSVGYKTITKVVKNGASGNIVYWCASGSQS